MKFLTATVIASALIVAPSAHGFTSSGARSVRSQNVRLYASLPTPEESAKALSEYMAKSHEEKLRAVKEVEAKKAAEIEALKKEVELLKKNAAPTSSAITTSAVAGSQEEMAAKLLAYQQFMSQYIVKAQEEKIKAIKAAEAATAKKFEDKLLLLGGSASAAPVSPVEVSPLSIPGSTESKLYTDRNARVSAAGQVGKSRWGEMETNRAAQQSVNVGVQVVNGSVEKNGSTVTPVDVPKEVIEADHGLRADGGVGGLTLAERVALGATASPLPATTNIASPVPVVSQNQVLYNQRNAMVAAAAKAGKSRWGDKEAKRAAEQTVNIGVHVVNGSVAKNGSAVAPVAVPKEVIEADHGLRADGGVGGLTLAERVALGAAAPKGTTAAVTIPVVSKNQVLYHHRNVMVAAAAKAGKSRWGSMESERAAKVAATPLTGSVATSVKTVSPNVAAADHGLRADGSVGGPSLAERVNLGAQLLKNRD